MRQHGQDTALWVLSLGISTLLSDTRKPLSFSRHSLSIFVPDTAPRNLARPLEIVAGASMTFHTVYDFSLGRNSYDFSILQTPIRTLTAMLYDSCLCDLHRFTLRFLTVLSRMSSCRSFFPSVHVHTKSLYPLYSFFVFFRCSLQFCTWQCMFLSVNLFLSMLVLCLCLCLCCACVGVSVLCFVRRLRKVQNNKLFLLLFVFMQKCLV